MNDKPTFCVDLDGTLGDYSGGWQGYENIGPPFPGAVEFTKQLSELGDVIIYTCRCKSINGDPPPEELRAHVEKWLDQHGFTYHGIENGQGKPFAHAYIDDRGVPCRPEELGAAAYTHALVQAAALAGIDLNLRKDK